MSELVETYRGCKIYIDLRRVAQDIAPYGTPCLPGEWFWTAQATRKEIDDILDPIEPPPPEEPEDGLFAQIVAAIKTWVNEVWSSWLQPIWDWIDEKLAGVRDWVNQLAADMTTYWEEQFAKRGERIAELDARWEKLTGKTIPDLLADYEEKSKELRDGLDQLGIDLEDAMDAMLIAEREWTLEAIVKAIPWEYLSDPSLFITDMIGNVTAGLMEASAKSFWEGFEEGLEEESV